MNHLTDSCVDNCVFTLEFGKREVANRDAENELIIKLKKPEINVESDVNCFNLRYDAEECAAQK